MLCIRVLATVIDSCCETGWSDFTRLVLGGIISVLLWVGSTPALSGRAATWLLSAVVQIWSLLLSPRLGLVCQVTVTDSRCLSFLHQPKPARMAAFLLYLPSASVLMISTIGVWLEGSQCVPEKGKLELYGVVNAG